MLQVNTIGLTTSGVAVGAVGAHQGAATAAAMRRSPRSRRRVLMRCRHWRPPRLAPRPGLQRHVRRATAMLLAASEGMTAVGAAYEGVDAAAPLSSSRRRSR
ncbi:hypothetical protein I553_3826 [Mycobacterium xenopi 4042]|uniref:PE family protein n=1 Tax=Mycobacterium xenopi 4042 TaxID=1299334 RepID=X8A211_MYCXE|nr:hypothetical protein I553_3826 [Mycobacterium xenopi 4042]